jgi:hypothetical protein
MSSREAPSVGATSVRPPGDVNRDIAGHLLPLSRGGDRVSEGAGGPHGPRRLES